MTNHDRKMKTMGICALLGASPIPIVGEIALSKLFYDVLSSSDAPLFKDSKGSTAGIATASALLVRWGLYTEFYIPLAKAAYEMFS